MMLCRADFRKGKDNLENSDCPIRVALMTEYDGTDFVGFQRQNNGRSVQGVLEKALEKVYGRPLTLYGCSRTDSGVHAKGHVSHVDVPFHILQDKIPLALNALLPEDVSVRKAAEVTNQFHARFGSGGKEYVYRICNSATRPAIERRWVAHVPGYLDIDRMKCAAAVFEGEHDFSAFCAKAGLHCNPIREIRSVCVNNCVETNLIEIRVNGKSFLYNMVRIMAGTILYAGQNKILPEEIAELFQTHNRRNAGKTMPAKGLTLERVFYQEDPFGKTNSYSDISEHS